MNAQDILNNIEQEIVQQEAPVLILDASERGVPFETLCLQGKERIGDIEQ